MNPENSLQQVPVGPPNAHSESSPAGRNQNESTPFSPDIRDEIELERIDLTNSRPSSDGARVEEVSDANANSREDLNALRKQFKALLSSNDSRDATLRELHSLLRRAIGDTRSSVADRLGTQEASAIRELEACMSDSKKTRELAQTTLSMLDALESSFPGRQTLWPSPNEKIAQGVSSLREAADAGTVKSIVAAAAAMASKNIAWYLSRAILLKDVSPNAMGALAGLVAGRWVLANGIAALAEYPLTVYGQKVWREDKGYSIITLGAITQGFDIFASLLALKATGNSIGVPEVLSLAPSALAVATTTGMLNSTFGKAGDLIGRVFGKEKVAKDDLIGRFRSESESSEQPGTESDLADIEEAQTPLPGGAEAQKQAATIRHLLDAFPKAAWAAKKELLNTFCETIRDLLDKEETIKALVSSRPVSTEGTAHDGFIEDAIKAFRDHQEHLQGLLAIQEHASADHEIAAQMDKVTNLLSEMEGIKKDLEVNGGTNYKALGFYLGMGAVYTGAILAGNVGQSTSLETLKNLNLRATLNAVGSVSAQTLANLGHLVLKDKPGVGKWTRFLKSWGIAAAITPAEFVPLQWGIALSDLGKSLAGRTPEAPAQNWPALPEVRAIQEFTRLAINIGFNVIALGEKLKPEHVVGLSINGVATAAGTALARLKAQTPPQSNQMGSVAIKI
jgi:hypothetical protein